MLINLEQNNERGDQLPTMKYRLYLAEMANVDIENYPKAVSATISSNVLKPGHTFKYLDCRVDSVNPNTEAGETPGTGKLVVEPEVEGLSKLGLAWTYENAGKRYVLVWERCHDGQKFIAGTPCSGGLRLSYTKIGKMEGNLLGIALKFEGGECPDPFYFYDGPLTLAAPVQVPVDSTTIALTENHQYALPSNTKAITITDIAGVTDSDVGRVIELVGEGVTNPSKIVSSTKFVLRNGVEFSAEPGKRISLQIATSGNSYYFFEVHRS